MRRRIERIADKVNELVRGKEVAYSYTKNKAFTVLIIDDKEVGSVTFNWNVLKQYEDINIVDCILECIKNREYSEIRKRSLQEINLCELLETNIMIDDEFWIDYEYGILHLIDSKDGYAYEVDLNECEIVEVRDSDIFNNMFICLKYEDLEFIIREVQNCAECYVYNIAETIINLADETEFWKIQYNIMKDWF